MLVCIYISVCVCVYLHLHLSCYWLLFPGKYKQCSGNNALPKYFCTQIQAAGTYTHSSTYPYTNHWKWNKLVTAIDMCLFANMFVLVLVNDTKPTKPTKPTKRELNKKNRGLKADEWCSCQLASFHRRPSSSSLHCARTFLLSAALQWAAGRGITKVAATTIGSRQQKVTLAFTIVDKSACWHQSTRQHTKFSHISSMYTHICVCVQLYLSSYKRISIPSNPNRHYLLLHSKRRLSRC